VVGKPNVLVVGTADTKSDEILFLSERLKALDANPMILDIGVLSAPSFTVAFSREEVAKHAGTTIDEIIALGDENLAMKAMARGASALAQTLTTHGEIDALLALGGSMGTDLALDVALALPLGFPKFIVSTVAYSHLIPPDRLAPDLMMILWAGGLYGLNSLCRSVLSQAAGAVVGAARTAPLLSNDKPVVAISSLGKGTLSYMVRLVPALEARGYEVAVFHATGMGGRAMETLARRGAFVAVLDFALCEVSNCIFGGAAHAGPDRLEGAGAAGIPQLVAAGAMDMIDFATWSELPERFKDRDYHAHNRLIASVNLTAEERAECARVIGHKLATAIGPTVFLSPLKGIEEWDRLGGVMHNAAALQAFNAALRREISGATRLIELDCHINDAMFTDKVLEIFDEWAAAGMIPQPAVPIPLTEDRNGGK